MESVEEVICKRGPRKLTTEGHHLSLARLHRMSNLLLTRSPSPIGPSVCQAMNVITGLVVAVKVLAQPRADLKAHVRLHVAAQAKPLKLPIIEPEEK